MLKYEVMVIVMDYVLQVVRNYPLLYLLLSTALRMKLGTVIG